MIWRQIRNYCI